MMYEAILFLITGSVIGGGVWYYFNKDTTISAPKVEKDEEEIIAENDLARLDQALKELEKKLKNKNPKQVEDYWNDDN